MQLVGEWSMPVLRIGACTHHLCNLTGPHSRQKNALCSRCAKSRLFSITGSHGSQGPEFCTLQPLLVHQGHFYLV